MLTTHCQRWTRRRCTWRPAGEPFVPSRFEVAPIAGDAITADAVTIVVPPIGGAP